MEKRMTCYLLLLRTSLGGEKCETIIADAKNFALNKYLRQMRNEFRLTNIFAPVG